MWFSAALEEERERAFVAVARALQAAGERPPPWPPVPIRWNRRLRRAGRAVVEARGGRFLHAAIELSPSYFEVYPQDLPGILVHEAVHVGLALCGLPFGHGPAFLRACLRAGGLPHSRHMPGRVWRYRCPVCSTVLERRRRASGDRWCASCASEAQDRGEKPFVPDRALVLVGVAFRGLDPGPAKTPG
jgi:hypothetical protein